MSDILGLIFDKDGTLFDFRATWGGWSRRLLEKLAADNGASATLLGDMIGYDMTSGDFAPGSPVIAHTVCEIAEIMLPCLPGMRLESLVADMNRLALEADLVEATPLLPLVADLSARGVKLGLATNDAEEPARAHLEKAGVAGFFDFIAGFDSGHGTKPDPAPLLAFARRTGLDPASVAMVGDSRHDLVARRRTEMRTVAVLTGIATSTDLADLADVILADISHLPAWIEQEASLKS